MSKPQSTNGSESEFEFIETPKAPTPSFEKFEECGVRTTSVLTTLSHPIHPNMWPQLELAKLPTLLLLLPYLREHLI